MVTTHDVNTGELIKQISVELKKNGKITPPIWAKFAKTGTFKERVPEDAEWWYIRAASILRKVSLNPVGVERLRTVYGGRKNMGYKPERRKDASGNVIRKCIQQLESAGLVKKGKKGREITPAGQKMLENIAFSVSKEQPVSKKKVIEDVKPRGDKKEEAGETNIKPAKHAAKPPAAK